MQLRLDHMFISNTLQQFVNMAEILAPISTDHYVALFSPSKKKKPVSEVREFGNLIAP